MTPRPIQELMRSQAVRDAPSIVRSWLFSLLMNGEKGSGFAGQAAQVCQNKGSGDRRLGKNGMDGSVRNSERLS
jgi:hypothetical protein